MDSLSTLRPNWAKDDIRVNAITPSGVESGQNDTFKQNFSNYIPMGRIEQPEEVVGALIYLMRLVM